MCSYCFRILFSFQFGCEGPAEIHFRPGTALCAFIYTLLFQESTEQMNLNFSLEPVGNNMPCVRNTNVECSNLVPATPGER